VSALASKADEIARNENGSFVPGGDVATPVNLAERLIISTPTDEAAAFSA